MSRITRPLVPTLLAAALAAVLVPGGAANAATIFVNTESDADAADGFCSLREAILAADDDTAHNECPAGAGPDRIVFSLTTPATIALTDDLPPITDTLLLRGPGPLQLVIDGGDLYRLLDFDTADGGWFGVERLSLYRGRSPGGVEGDGGGAWIGPGETAAFRRVGFIQNHSANAGGGLAIGSAGSAPSTATVTECLFLSNVAEGPGGGGGLGLIGTGGEARVVRSTFTDNGADHANGSGGAIIATRGNLFLEASTVSGNRANASGGGILIVVSGAPPLFGGLDARDSTVTDNLANADGDLAGDGGGIAFIIGNGFTADLSLRNTAVTGNLDSGASTEPDVECDTGVQLVASGTSFVGSNAGCETLLPDGSPNAAGDYVGTAAAPLVVSFAALGDYGGPTPTRPPLAPMFTEGVAIALIDSGSCPDSFTDQRGSGDAEAGTRRVDVVEFPNGPGSDGCDIGAVEVGTDPHIDPTIFADGFENGNTLIWSSEVP